MHKYGISSALCVRALLYSEDGSICVMRHSLTHWPPTPHSLTQLSLPHPISQSVVSLWVGHCCGCCRRSAHSIRPRQADRLVGQVGRSVTLTSFMHFVCLFACALCTSRVPSLAFARTCFVLCCRVVELWSRCVGVLVVELLSRCVLVVELLLWSCCCGVAVELLLWSCCCC